MDVAYVHRSFGCKEKLFQAALDEAGKNRAISDLPLKEIVPLLTRELFSGNADDWSADVEGLMILIRSLSVPSAAGPVGERLEKLFIEPIRQKLGDQDGFRAAAIMSMLMGMSILHRILDIEALTNQDPEQAARRVQNLIDLLVDNPGPKPEK